MFVSITAGFAGEESLLKYTYFPEARVWSRDESNVVTFSDGEQVEQNLLKLLKNSTDVSLSSSEVRKGIIDWPTEYHLSPLRQNLLRPFKFSHGTSVLELGCGCGAITRQLGEGGLKVTALEGNFRRAQITGERCRDLDNVQIYVDNIQNFSLEGTYDLVTLIGVLEYSQIFIRGENPVRNVLEMCFKKLNDQGTMIIAIENKLGLKYFAGHSEDHLGRPFAGIQNLYTAQGPITFGLNEIKSHITNAGFRSVECFFPFPDYKLPQVVMSESALSEAGFLPEQLLACLKSRSYGQRPPIYFDESLAWESVAQNGLLGQLANSFLLFAHKGEKTSTAPRWLAKHYTMRDNPQFCTETSFVPGARSSARIDVVKLPLYEAAPLEPIGQFRFEVGVSAYQRGANYVNGLKRLLRRDSSEQELLAWIGRYVQFLLSHAVDHEAPLLEKLLPGDFIDCVPHNLIESPDGVLCFIDREWRSLSPISLPWVLIRGLAHSLDRVPVKGALVGQSYAHLISKLLNELGYNLESADFEKAKELEHSFQEFVQGAKYDSREITHLEQLLDREILNRDANDSADPKGSEAFIDELKSKMSSAQKELTIVMKEIKRQSSDLREAKDALDLCRRQIIERDLQAQELRDKLNELKAKSHQS